MVGVPPDVMGIGPAYAIPVAVKKAGENRLSFRQCWEQANQTPWNEIYGGTVKLNLKP